MFGCSRGEREKLYVHHVLSNFIRLGPVYSNDIRITEFANTLGRIASSSVFTPREQLDVRLASAAQAAALEKRKEQLYEMKSHERLLEATSEEEKGQIRDSDVRRIKWYARRRNLLHIEDIHNQVLDFVDLKQRLSSRLKDMERMPKAEYIRNSLRKIETDIEDAEAKLRDVLTPTDAEEQETLMSMLDVAKGREVVLKICIVADEFDKMAPAVVELLVEKDGYSELFKVCQDCCWRSFLTFLPDTGALFRFHPHARRVHIRLCR